MGETFLKGRTLVDLLRWRAGQQPEQLAYTLGCEGRGRVGRRSVEEKGDDWHE